MRTEDEIRDRYIHIVDAVFETTPSSVKHDFSTKTITYPPPELVHAHAALLVRIREIEWVLGLRED